MRNILMTVMLLIVTAVLFTSIINKDDTGIRQKIQMKGGEANTQIENLQP